MNSKDLIIYLIGAFGLLIDGCFYMFNIFDSDQAITCAIMITALFGIKYIIDMKLK